MGRVLVVEDDPRLGPILAMLLAREGYTAHVLEDAEDALRLLRSVAYDVVIVDVSLEGLSGDDFVRVLRRAGSRIPAILISGLPHDELAEKAAACGATAWLPKPIDTTTLIVAVEEALVRTSQIPPSR